MKKQDKINEEREIYIITIYDDINITGINKQNH